MIAMVEALIRKEPVINFDALLEDIRNTLRQELAMEKIDGHIWWFRFQMPNQTEMKPEPNKAMEPTPVNVTIPAAQEVAPFTSAAHLER
jgi:hypothetical protein